MDHIVFASELGFLMARAKLAAENPSLENELGFWNQLPQKEKNKLLGINIGSPAEDDCISGYTE